MSGILGTNFRSNSFQFALKQICNKLDLQNSVKIKNNEFGHTKSLSIKLEEELNQTILFDDIVLIFTGVIYNYKQLIKQENLLCKTKNSSEVIIRLYKKYEFDFLNKLNGMFSFSIYDIKKDRFFCARDRYGKKPFFYYYKNNQFIFSSSIKAVLKILDTKPKLNKIALSKYLQYFVSFGKDTFYQDIYALEPASYLVFQKDIFIKKYYKIKTYKRIKSEKQALEDIENILIKSVSDRLQSGVEMGTLLSGGIDSSFISTLYSRLTNKRINTFSIGYKEYKNYCELEYAKIVSKHINSYHTEIKISKKDFIDNFEDSLNKLEVPHGDSAAVPLNILTKKINQMGIKTVLSGEGSDELFLGYDNYRKFLKYYNFKNSLSNEQNLFLDEIISTLQNNTKESEYLRRIVKKQNLYLSFGEIFTHIQKRKLFKKVPNFKVEKTKSDPIDWMSYIDLKIWLGESLLSKVDRISRNNLVEIRTPFLDYNLVDYLFSIDSNLKVGDTNKYLLKKIASKYIPMQIVNRTKKGFNSPFNEWLQDEFKDDILNTILYVNKHSNLFNDEYVNYIYNLAKNRKFKQHLYSLFVFSLWYKKEYL